MIGVKRTIDTTLSTAGHHVAIWLWCYLSLDRLAKTPGIDPVEFDRACHDEAWGCAYSRVWRTYLDVIREAA